MFQLTSGLVSETAIPTQYLQYTEILTAIQTYNWSIAPSTMPGWTRLLRVINYSS